MSPHRFPAIPALALLALATLSTPAAAQAGPNGDGLERGKYLATIMDCSGCHTTGAMTGKPDPAGHLAGSDIGFLLPGLGTFYPSNLTPDRATGLGNWTETEIITALRKGTRPDGRVLAEIMPWRAYATLTDADARALVTYLKSLTPVSHKVPGPFGDGEVATAPYLAPVMPKP